MQNYGRKYLYTRIIKLRRFIDFFPSPPHLHPLLRTPQPMAAVDQVSRPPPTDRATGVATDGYPLRYPLDSPARGVNTVGGNSASSSPTSRPSHPRQPPIMDPRRTLSIVEVSCGHLTLFLLLLLFLLFSHNAKSVIAQEERLATSPN